MLLVRSNPDKKIHTSEQLQFRPIHKAIAKRKRRKNRQFIPSPIEDEGILGSGVDKSGMKGGGSIQITIA